MGLSQAQKTAYMKAVYSVISLIQHEQNENQEAASASSTSTRLSGIDHTKTIQSKLGLNKEQFDIFVSILMSEISLRKIEEKAVKSG
jgi:hypothetical protein